MRPDGLVRLQFAAQINSSLLEAMRPDGLVKLQFAMQINSSLVGAHSLWEVICAII